MAKPPLNGVAETEYTKSQQGGLTPSSFRTSGGVHELVARAMRGKCVRQRGKGKIGSFAAPRNLILPRVRTKCARKPSRFVHASLHARWIMGGAGVNPVHALTKARIFASLLQWEKVARFTAADEVLPCVYCQKNLFRYVRTQTRTQLQPPQKTERRLLAALFLEGETFIFHVKE